MSVENMAEISLVLFATAGILAAVAVVMFFSFNIPKCLRMVSGRFFVRDQKKAEGETRQPAKTRTEELSQSGETLQLGDNVAEETLLLDGDAMKTVMLDGTPSKEALPFGVDNLELVQDIVYKGRC